MTLAKAEFIQIDARNQPVAGKDPVAVQFNPESLRIAYGNQLQQTSAQQQPSGGARGGRGRGGSEQTAAPSRLVGAGNMKLSATLWFDAASPVGRTGSGVDDVRRLTREVAFFITPFEERGQFVAPGVRFLWGSFKFDGIMESLEEGIELFSPEGVPLRASLSFTLTGNRIVLPEAASGAGTRRLATVTDGDTVQGISSSNGSPGDWRQLALRNGIEDPLRVGAGRVLDLGRLGRS